MNDSFSPIPLDEIKGADKRSIRASKETKIGKTSFENILLIIWSYWPNLYFPRTSLGFYRDNHIGKSRDNLGGDNPDIGIPDTDRVDTLDRHISNANKINNPGIYTSHADRVANPSIHTSDIDEAKTQGIRISDIDRDRKTNNSGTGRWPDEDGRAEELSISILDADGIDNPGIL